MRRKWIWELVGKPVATYPDEFSHQVSVGIKEA